MAGDWISMRHDLPDDPAVIRIADACDISRQHVVGCLHSVWTWFDKHTTNGKAPGVGPSHVDDLAGVPGFADAMIAAGWLRTTGDALSIPKFKAFMSQSAKTRQLTARRVARHRQRKCNAESVTAPLPQNRTAEQRTEEKSRRDQRCAQASTLQGPSSPDGGIRKLGRLLPGSAGKSTAAAERGANSSAAEVEIVRLMGERGCDTDLRGVVAKTADVQIVRDLASEFDRQGKRIRNPGGWWREKLRRSGTRV